MQLCVRGAEIKTKRGGYMGRERILIVDDDPDIRKIVKIYLSGEEYDIIEAADGEEALQLADETIALVLLDIMMPGMDGMEVCAKIREHYTMPILFLTAKADDADKVIGLTIGADDYITKPFNTVELIARIKSNLRRYLEYEKAVPLNRSDSSKLQISDLEIDLDAHTVLKDGRQVVLTKTEFNILTLLAQNCGNVFSIDKIYRLVWGEESILNAENTVSVHIRKLREKLEEDAKNPKYIKTIWGVGYKVDKTDGK